MSILGPNGKAGTNRLTGVIASYLRERRQASNLSQNQLAGLSRGGVGEFDHSWVSQWELAGPKEGAIKTFNYLNLLGADTELIGELLQLPIVDLEIPESTTSRQAVGKAQQLAESSNFGAALSWSLAAVELAERNGEPIDLSGAWLVFSICAKRLEKMRAAEFAVGRALAWDELSETAPALFASAGIQAAVVHTNRGRPQHAHSVLDRVESSLAEFAPHLRGALLHARGYLAHDRGDVEGSLTHYSGALVAYAEPMKSLQHASVEVCIALAEARLGRKADSLATLGAALSRAEHGSLTVQLLVNQVAGRVLSVNRELPQAIACYLTAESLAKQLQMPLRLFELRLALNELAQDTGDQALASLMERRLMADRLRLKLPPRLARLYDDSIRGRARGVRKPR